jgi:hypothetical protein
MMKADDDDMSEAMDDSDGNDGEDSDDDDESLSVVSDHQNPTVEENSTVSSGIRFRSRTVSMSK